MLLTLCIKIFFVRILDVSLGTVRTILTIKERKIIASVIGFFEIAVWFAIVREAITTNESSLWVIFAYASGFAAGTYIGGAISERFIEGNLGVQVFTEMKDELISIIRSEGYGVSVIDVKGKDKEKDKYILFIGIDKKHFEHLRNLIKKLDDKAFIVVNETKYVQNGFFK